MCMQCETALNAAGGLAAQCYTKFHREIAAVGVQAHRLTSNTDPNDLCFNPIESSAHYTINLPK